MNFLSISYVIGTTVMFYFLAFIWSTATNGNLFLKMVFVLNAITGSILIVHYFAMRV